jgi:hypothetical protein
LHIVKINTNKRLRRRLKLNVQYAEFSPNTERKTKCTGSFHPLLIIKTIPKQTKIILTVMIASRKATFGSAWFAVVWDVEGTKMQMHTNIL